MKISHPVLKTFFWSTLTLMRTAGERIGNSDENPFGTQVLMQFPKRWELRQRMGKQLSSS